jgi:membrane-associated phospholipid phosphatase
MPQFDFRSRIKAATVHLSLSALVALAASFVVFLVWYPGEYRVLAGGTELLLLIMMVDIVLGPLLTFAIYNKAKGHTHLRRDLLTIVALQLLALLYGLYVVFLARPVVLIFEFDRFRIVSDSEVVKSELPSALPAYQQLPIGGPITVSLRRSEPGAERSNALATAVFEGVDTSQRPIFWVPYGTEERAKATSAARPVELLSKQYPSALKSIEHLLMTGNYDKDTVRFLPVRAKNDGVVLLDQSGEVIGFLDVDGYF